MKQLRFNSTHCCGIVDVSGLNDDALTTSESVLKPLSRALVGLNTSNCYLPWGWNNYLNRTEAFPKGTGKGAYNFIYARDKDNRYAHRSIEGRKVLFNLKKVIENNKLGQFIILPEVPNPVHSGRTLLTQATFIPDREAMFRYGIKKGYLLIRKKEKSRKCNYVASSWAREF